MTRGVTLPLGTLSVHTPFPRPMTLLEQARDLQQIAAGPNVLDAIDTYYHDDVTIVEATGDTFHGRETQKGRMREWHATIDEVHGGEIKAVAATETAPGTGVALVESSFDATFKEGGRMQIEEVAVQRWKDGKVVHERFYYNAPDA